MKQVRDVRYLASRGCTVDFVIYFAIFFSVPPCFTFLDLDMASI